ncbi:hypothetical protein BDFB_011272, partial [Asbolus verrucosus]
MKIVRLLYWDILESNIFRALVLVIFVQFSMIQVLQSYYFLKIFEIGYFVKYAPVYFGTFFFQLLVDYWCIINTKNFVKFMRNEFVSWKICKADRRTFDRIKKESNIISTILLVNIIVALACAVLYMLPDDIDEEIFLIFYFINENAPKWKATISWIIRAPYPFVAYVSILPLNTAIHHMWQTIFQFYLFLDRIKKLNEVTFFTDEGFQREVKRKLIFCIERHINIIEYITRIGQMMEAEAESIFHHLKYQNWYNWNDENKRLYLIFLSGAAKPLRIQFSDSVGINYEMAKSLT